MHFRGKKKTPAVFLVKIEILMNKFFRRKLTIIQTKSAAAVDNIDSSAMDDNH